MLSRFVRLTLAGELAVYAALGAWAHARLGWSPWAALGGALAALLGLRLALVCGTSLVGWKIGSPRAPAHRIALADVPRYVLGEYRALLADNLWQLPWESIAVRPDPAPAPMTQPPVILVHGYLSNRGYFAPLVRALESAGIGPLFTPDFPVLFESIERFAAALHDEIERIAQGCAQPRVILVCHSMGGLAARLYLQEHGPGRIARLITISSPHHGTALASAGLGFNARQMHRGSDFLRALERAEAGSPPTVPTLSIWSPHDNLVAPQDTACLPWARNVALPGLGHVAILGSPRTFEVLREELAR